MSTAASSGAPVPDGHGADVAVTAERRWAIVVGLIIAAIVAMMIVTGLHWSAMPPSRVETVDPRTLHVEGEFVEANLGTTVASDGWRANV